MEMWTFAFCLSFVLFVADHVSGETNSTQVTSATVKSTTVTPLTTTNVTTTRGQFGNYDMLQRAFYVLIGISVLAVLYFVVRTCSIKKKPQRKKYGLLSDYDDNMEMGSMESDEEKIFESRNIRR